MSGTQHLRLFLQERLISAAEEIFGVVEKSICEYEEQVVQSKREVEQLKQHILTLTTAAQPHTHLDTIDSQPVSEELLPLHQLNPRQELMSSQEDEAVQHQSPQVKEEQVDLSIIPHSETSIYNIVTNGFVTSESTSDSQLIPPYTTSTVAVQHSTDAKEERMDLSIVPDSETCSSNIVANGLVKSESTIESQLIPSCTTVTAQHSTQVKEEQADISIIPGSETSISISGINGFVTPESASDSQLFPSPGTETAITSHDVANNCYESEGPGLAFSQSADVYCIVQKICCFCRKQFHSYAELMKHVEESHTGHKAFKCPECDKEFACRDTWADHCRIHTGVKPHSCPVCGKLFTLHSCLEVHMRTHTDSQPVSEELFSLQQLNPRQELMSSQEDEAVQHQSPQAKEQMDISIVPDSETSIYNSGTHGFVTSESTSDSQLMPSYSTETAITSHGVTNKCNESDEAGWTFSQRDDDIFSLEQIVCSICRQRFHRDTDLMKHVKDTHIGHKPFKCPDCDREYIRRDKLALHYRIHTGVKPHSCHVCGKSFTKRSCLTVHMRIHTDSPPVSEELLPLQELNPRHELMYSQEDEAVQHQSPQAKEQMDFSIIPHSETSIYNSGTNGFVTSASTSDSHLIPSYTTETAITSHGVANKCNDSDGAAWTISQRDDDIFCLEQIVCSICRQRFHRDTDLMKHVKDTHIGHKAFKCPDCDREYTRRDKLAIHYRIHTGVKPHSCHVCGKSFTKRSCLTVHMRIHTGEKPYFCNKCGKMVAYSYHLKRCQM